jgi:hypothetical protein
MQMFQRGDFINTLLQQGVRRSAVAQNCFNSFLRGVETVETVPLSVVRGIHTPLKWGVNGIV